MAGLRPSGGYRDSCSFQTTTIIYDATYWFREKFLDARSRTVDQMVQAVRSGRQNIDEGSRAAAASPNGIGREEQIRQISQIKQIPDCPLCGSPMVLRTDKSAGKQFWGCSAYPDCR